MAARRRNVLQERAEERGEEAQRTQEEMRASQQRTAALEEKLAAARARRREEEQKAEAAARLEGDEAIARRLHRQMQEAICLIPRSGLPPATVVSGPSIRLPKIVNDTGDVALRGGLPAL